MPVGRCRIHQKTSMCNSGVLGYLGLARFLLMRQAGVLPPCVWCPSIICLFVQSLVIDRPDLGIAIGVRGSWTIVHPRPSGLGHFRERTRA